MDCWHHEIDKAKTEDEIVRSASDYLVLWTPREIDPTRRAVDMSIRSPDDIERVKSWISDRESTAVSPIYTAHMRELSGYFRHASSRLGEIRQAG